MTEDQLIRQARPGDSDAWEALTRRHQEPVFRLAWLLTLDERLRIAESIR